MQISTVLLTLARVEFILTSKESKIYVLDYLMIHFRQLLSNYSRYEANLNMKGISFT